MNVLIKGMEMPENCYKCPFAMEYYSTLYMSKAGKFRKDYCCVITHKTLTSTKRSRFCPLFEVVRCKDCEFNDDGYRCPFREAGWGYDPDRYCSFGERKEGEE